MPQKTKFDIEVEFSKSDISIGIGFCIVGEERYVYIDLLFWEIAIGKLYA